MTHDPEPGTRRIGHPIKELRIAEVEWQGALLFVLWTMDEDGLWVMPSASRTRQDMRTLGETIRELGSLWHPDAARRFADLENDGLVYFVHLTDDEQNAVGAELVCRLPPAGVIS
jgi:hypothetical protein